MAPILVRLLLNSFWRNSCKTVDVPCDYEASCFASSLVLFLPVWSSTTALWPVSTMNSLYSNYCISSLWVKSFGEQGAEDLSLFCVSYPFTIKCHSEVLGAISWTRFLSLQDFGRIRFCTLLASKWWLSCWNCTRNRSHRQPVNLLLPLEPRCIARRYLPALMLFWPSPYLTASQELVVWLHCFLWCPFLSLVKLPGLNLQFLSNSSYSQLVITGFFAVQLLSIHTLFLGSNQFV